MNNLTKICVGLNRSCFFLGMLAMASIEALGQDIIGKETLTRYWISSPVAIPIEIAFLVVALGMFLFIQKKVKNSFYDNAPEIN